MERKGLKRAIAMLALGGAVVALGGVAVDQVAAQQAPPARAPGQDRHDQFLARVASNLNVSTDQLKQAMDQARQELGLPQGPGGPGGPGRGGPRMGLDAAAKAIGISSDQFRQELRGKSLADVANAHSVDPTKVADALKADAAAHIDQEVSAGRLTAEQAAQRKAGLSQRIDQMMNRQVPADAPNRGPRGDAPGRTGFERSPKF